MVSGEPVSPEPAQAECQRCSVQALTPRSAVEYLPKPALVNPTHALSTPDTFATLLPRYHFGTDRTSYSSRSFAVGDDRDAWDAQGRIDTDRVPAGAERSLVQIQSPRLLRIHAMVEFEFHISPVPSPSNDLTG
jgi:hypothetical protein